MNVLDLFSNIGGHALGLHQAGGFRTVQFVEIEPRRQRLLAHHFPGIPLHDDVRTFDGIACDLVIGGPPCQRTSVSAAIHGRRDGHTLWPDMLRIGINSGAEWFVVEQPPGNAEWETEVTRSLAQARFHCARIEFSARDLGAPHSGWLDRNAAVEAIGDSNPPAMATVLGRAIMTAHPGSELASQHHSPTGN